MQAARGGQLARERRRGVGAAQRAQQVQRHDVGRALPDRVQRHLAVDARHHALAVFLDVAVAAQALHGLLAEVAAALADPELGDRRQHAAQRGLVRALGVPGLLAAVDRRGQAQREHGCGLAVEGEIGQHVLHQRLLDQPPAEGAAVSGVVQRQRQRRAHQPGGAERAVEPGQRAHGEDLRHAAALVADAPGQRVVELDLAAGVGVVAELVLEALDVQRVDAAVGQQPRQQEAAQPAGGLREHQVRIAHRRRHEPLVPGDAVALAPVVAAVTLGARAVAAHVRAALLLGHAHAERDRALVGQRQEARVVVARDDARQPGRGQRRVGAQRRRDRVGHRHRAQHRGLAFGEQHEAGGTLEVRAGAGGPRRAVQPVAQRRGHQRVVARVELDLVDAVAKAVVGMQLRWPRVGQPGVLEHRRRAALEAQRGQPGAVEAGQQVRERIAQRPVARPQVVVDERRRLVGDFVGEDGTHRGPPEVVVTIRPAGRAACRSCALRASR